MAALKPFWDNRSLAIVHACGSPDSTRSHFDAQDYMESATPGVKSTKDGWLNRYLQVAHEGETPLTRGRDDAADAAVAAGHGAGAGDGQRRRVRRARRHGRTRLVRNGLRRRRGSGAQGHGGRCVQGDADVVVSRWPAAVSAGRMASSYPRTPFGQSLQEIARLAKADVGLEIAFAESGQWDHHVNEGGATGQIANRLDDFARGIAALTLDLGDRMADTIILTMSEFGRAVVENGNRGTDHGHGNAMMLIGGGVKGGEIYGDWPGLKEDAAPRGPRPEGDDRLPRRLRRGRDAPPRRRRKDRRARLPRLRRQAFGLPRRAA